MVKDSEGHKVIKVGVYDGDRQVHVRQEVTGNDCVVLRMATK